MPDDLIDLPLGDEASEPTFPVDEMDGPVAQTARRRPRRPTRRKRPRIRPLWLVLGAIVGLVAVWLYWRPSRLEVSPGEPAPVSAPVGQASDPVEIEIRNAGRRRVDIDDILVHGEGFSVGRRDCGPVLDAGTGCTVQVEFAPPAMGPSEGHLEVIGSQRGGSSRVPLSGEGLGVRLVPEPERLDFGSTPVEGASPSLTLKISNSGTLAGSPGRVSIDSDDFRLAGSGCKGVLEEGESCDLELFFQPRRMGERRGRLTTDGGVAGPLPAVELVGRGTGPGFEIRPLRLVFGEQKVGAESAPQRVMWINQGDAAWNLTNPRLTGKGFRLAGSDCDRAPVPVDGSCSASVAFVPTQAGPMEGGIVLVHRSGERFPPVDMVGIGTAPRLSLDLLRVNFPPTPVGRSSAPRALRLTNEGSAIAELERVAVEGPGAGSFRIDSDCGSRLSVGSTCTLHLRLTPRVSGELSASLRVDSDAPGSPLTLPLVGNGASPQLALSRRRMDFATVPQGEFQDLQLGIGNTGSAPLEIQAVAVEGAGFAILGDGCEGTVVVAGGDCQTVVRFNPGAPGAYVGRVAVRSSAGGAEVPLSGLAGEPPVPRGEIEPDELYFDSTPVGARSPVETVTVTSRGPGRLRIESVRIQGDGAEHFRLVPATCADLTELVAASRCTLGVRYKPESEGSHRARIVVLSNAQRSQLTVGLRGETSP